MRSNCSISDARVVNMAWWRRSMTCDDDENGGGWWEGSGSRGAAGLNWKRRVVLMSMLSKFGDVEPSPSSFSSLFPSVVNSGCDKWAGLSKPVCFTGSSIVGSSVGKGGFRTAGVWSSSLEYCRENLGFLGVIFSKSFLVELIFFSTWSKGVFRLPLRSLLKSALTVDLLSSASLISLSSSLISLLFTLGVSEIYKWRSNSYFWMAMSATFCL